MIVIDSVPWRHRGFAFHLKYSYRISFYPFNFSMNLTGMGQTIVTPNSTWTVTNKSTTPVTHDATATYNDTTVFPLTSKSNVRGATTEITISGRTNPSTTVSSTGNDINTTNVSISTLQYEHEHSTDYFTTTSSMEISTSKQQFTVSKTTTTTNGATSPSEQTSYITITDNMATTKFNNSAFTISLGTTHHSDTGSGSTTSGTATSKSEQTVVTSDGTSKGSLATTGSKITITLDTEDSAGKPMVTMVNRYRFQHDFVSRTTPRYRIEGFENRS